DREGLHVELEQILDGPPMMVAVALRGQPPEGEERPDQDRKNFGSSHRQPPEGVYHDTMLSGNRYASESAAGRLEQEPEGVEKVSKRPSSRVSNPELDATEGVLGPERERPFGREALDALAMDRYVQLHEAVSRGVEVLAGRVVVASSVTHSGEVH